MPRFNISAIINSNSSPVFYTNSQVGKATLSSRTIVDPESFSSSGAVHLIFQTTLPTAPQVNEATSEITAVPSEWINVFSSVIEGIIPDDQQLEAAGIDSIIDISYFN